MDPRSCQAVPAVFLLVLLLGFGCAGPAPVDLKPQGSITVAVDPNRHRTVAKAQFLNEVVIRLPAPNPPDFVWQIAVHDSRYLRQLTKIKPAAKPRGKPPCPSSRCSRARPAFASSWWRRRGGWKSIPCS